MIQFQYVRAKSPKGVVDVLAKDANAKIIAGGTNLIDLMKKGVMSPQKLVDINNLPLKSIVQVNKAIRIGSLALNSDVSENKLVIQKQPLLSQALKAGASAQLRNMATVGGNMMQRTRCSYFYEVSLPCNKREPGSGCGALEGINRMHAIFGWSDKCIAVHPSDMSVALAALDATVLVTGPKGERTIPFTEFHRLPGDTPQFDNNLAKNELIVSIDIPDNNFNKHHYLKVRDRASYAFALISVAVALRVDGKKITNARLAMGGVAHKPWRLFDAEKALVGKQVSEDNFREVANIAFEGAKGFEHNSFKLKMGPNAIVQALKNATGI